MANINIYKCHKWAFFASSHRFRTIHISKLWPIKCRSRSWLTAFAVASFDGKSPTSYLMAIVMFALSLTVYEIFTEIYLKNEGQGQWVENGTCAIRLEMFDSLYVIFFRILAIWEQTFAQKVRHTQRETEVMTIGKICKTYLPKNDFLKAESWGTQRQPSCFYWSTLYRPASGSPVN